MPNLNGFDANTVEPVENNFEPLPAGKYLAKIAASQEKTSQNIFDRTDVRLNVLPV
jgi:hypothetical protein